MSNTPHTTHITLRTPHTTPYTPYTTTHIPHPTLHTPHTTPFTPHSTDLTQHSTPNAPHTTHHSAHPTPHTPHPTDYPPPPPTKTKFPPASSTPLYTAITSMAGALQWRHFGSIIVTSLALGRPFWRSSCSFLRLFLPYFLLLFCYYSGVRFFPLASPLLFQCVNVHCASHTPHAWDHRSLQSTSDCPL